MNEHPQNQPTDMLKQMMEKSNENREKITERSIMTKARQLFDYPEFCDSMHRSPDSEERGEMTVDKYSYLRDDRGLLTYRRMYRIHRSEDGETLELIPETQVIDYTASPGALPLTITAHRFPTAEIDADVLYEEAEMCIDRHLVELADHNKMLLTQGDGRELKM